MSFLGGLISGYAGLTLEKERREHEEELSDRNNRISVVSAALNSGRLTPEAQEAALDELDELTGLGGKKGQKSPIRTVIGRLIGRPGQQQQVTPYTQRVPGEGAQMPPPNFGQIPQRKGAEKNQVPTLAPVPARPKVKIALSDQDLMERDIAGKKREFEEVEKPKLQQEHEYRMEEEKARIEGEAKKAQESQDRQDARQRYAFLHQTAMEEVRQSYQDRREQTLEAFRQLQETQRQKDLGDREDKKFQDAMDTLAKKQKADLVKRTATDLDNLEKQTSSAILKLKQQIDKEGLLVKAGLESSELQPEAEEQQKQLTNIQDAKRYFAAHQKAVLDGKENYEDVDEQVQMIQRFGATTNVGDIIVYEGQKIKVTRIDEKGIPHGVPVQ